jgi:predicted RNA-binding Zn-ribbon protein involved in translation (DUF1610 family)
MSCITPIFASQNQEENYDEEESFQRKKKVSIMILMMSTMVFLGLLFYSGRFGSFGFSFPSIFVLIIVIVLLRVISTAYRPRSRCSTQNHSQRQRSEPYPSEYKPTMIKRDQNYCLQCGSKIDRKDLDSVSVYYCSHCGNEIKNDRV